MDWLIGVALVMVNWYIGYRVGFVVGVTKTLAQLSHDLDNMLEQERTRRQRAALDKLYGRTK